VLQKREGLLSEVVIILHTSVLFNQKKLKLALWV
jgi:hypothetical protein